MTPGTGRVPGPASDPGSDAAPGAGPAAGPPPTSGQVLRVLSWNVRDLLDDPLAVHRVLRAARPDVACLQEVSRWPGSRTRLAALGRASGLAFVAGGRASAGTAVLVSPRVDVRGAATGRLPVTGRLTRPRGWAGVLVRLPATAPLRVVSAHLGLEGTERVRHVRLLLAAAGRDLPAAAPLVVGADLNEPPGGPAWRALAAAVVDPAPSARPTFRVPRPTRRIDAVLVGPGTRVRWYGTPPQVSAQDVRAGSDHEPVAADVVLPRVG